MQLRFGWCFKMFVFSFGSAILILKMRKWDLVEVKCLAQGHIPRSFELEFKTRSSSILS